MKKRIGYKLITIAVPMVLIASFLFKNIILSMTERFPTCLFYSIYHLYCPACGNTRSVVSLMNGDILSSLRFNIIPVVLLLFALCAYIEFATFSFGKQHRIIPRKSSFYLIGLGFLIFYIIVRNFIPYLTP